MEIEWRTVQLFLGDEGVSEASIAEHDSSKVRCTCAVFTASSKCKHTRWVRKKMDENHGVFSVKVPDSMDDEEAMDALQNTSDFRDFVIKYGKVVVL
jgi:hypothetical protein